MTTPDIQKILYSIYLKHPENLFSEFMKTCEEYRTKAAHTIAEIRARNNNNKKVRGDLFEEFCALYLKHVKGYETVWLLENVPNDILYSLSMKRQDMGIDIVVSTPEGYHAVQCKYKKPECKKSSVSWSALSTFYALCLRTGPWQKYIVMTTADYTRHQGPKTEKDISICLAGLKGISTADWLKMCEVTTVENPMNTNTVVTQLSDEEVRNKRLLYYSTIQNAPRPVG